VFGQTEAAAISTVDLQMRAVAAVIHLPLECSLHPRGLARQRV